MHYTLTYQRALNFGAALQAYALAKFLNEHGKQTEIIDYLPPYMHWQTKRPMKSLSGTIDKYKKYRRFSAFRKEFMPLTNKTYYSHASLQSLPNPESLIVGSDQVWNPNLHGKGKFDVSYLLALDFPAQINVTPKKVGYAVSAGTVRFADILNNNVRQAVSDFDAIGCREHSLREDIAFHEHTEVVLDPSLLLSDYSEVEIEGLWPSSLTPGEPYLVSYVVGSGDMLSTFEQRVKEAKSRFGLPVIHIGAKSISSADQNILDIGPREWLTFIKNAQFVLTNSFHGCAFSVNFNKQFIAIPHKFPELNQRQTSLLNSVGLKQKLLADNEPLTIANTSEIDFQPVNKKLKELVTTSGNFLLDSV